MSNVYSLVQDRFGMGTEAMEVLQEKAQRISVLSGFIARKVFEKQALNMSASEIQDTALITRTVHPENEGIYNGKEPFDPAKNRARGDYSLKVAEERGVELIDVQKAVVKGEGGLIEGRIIKLAETIIAVQYKRVQRGVEKEAITDSATIMSELLSDDRIDAELVKEIIGEQALEQLISAEKQAVPQKESEKTERKSNFEH